MWRLIRTLFFIPLYVIVTFVIGHFSFSLAIKLDDWVIVSIKTSEILQGIHSVINFDQQIWNLLFAISFPFTRRLLEFSLMEAGKLKIVMVITLSLCFFINFLGLQLNN
jgi:hypothetical protein